MEGPNRAVGLEIKRLIHLDAPTLPNVPAANMHAGPDALHIMSISAIMRLVQTCHRPKQSIIPSMSKDAAQVQLGL